MINLTNKDIYTMYEGLEYQFLMKFIIKRKTEKIFECLVCNRKNTEIEKIKHTKDCIYTRIQNMETNYGFMAGLESEKGEI